MTAQAGTIVRKVAGRRTSDVHILEGIMRLSQQLTQHCIDDDAMLVGIRATDEYTLAEIEKQAVKLDNHIAVYAANGVALKELTAVVRSTREDIAVMVEHSTAYSEKVTLMYAEKMDRDAVAKSDDGRFKRFLGWGAGITTLGIMFGGLAWIIMAVGKLSGAS